MTMASRGQMWPPLAQAPIPIRPVGPALVCVRASHVEFSVRPALFGMLQAASSLMSRRWMNTGVNVPWLPWVPLHLPNSLFLSPLLCPSLSLSLTLEMNSHIPLYDYCVNSVLFVFFILPFVWSGICPMHLSSEYHCVALA